MNKQLFFKSVYEDFLTLVNEKPSNLRFLVCEDYPCQSSDLRDSLYGEKEQDYTLVLINTINEFSTGLNNLTLWNEIISNYCDKEQKLDLYEEFIKYLVYYCLHQPYAFKQRLIFLATDLCYTKGLSKGLLKPNDINNKYIAEKDLKNVLNHEKVKDLWSNGQTLLKKIEKINGEDFQQKETKEYRHRSQHRVPPPIEIGINVEYVRSFSNSGNTTYSVSEEEALEISDLIPLLKEELNLMIEAFNAFRSLINDHTNPK